MPHPFERGGQSEDYHGQAIKSAGEQVGELRRNQEDGTREGEDGERGLERTRKHRCEGRTRRLANRG